MSISLTICTVALNVALSGFLDSRLMTSEPDKAISRFCDYPPGAGKLGFPRCLFENPFQQNPNFWLNGIDFSCASPWNDTYGTQRAGTAISKRHILMAKHFPLAVGTRIAFVGETGETSHYSVKATKSLQECDIMVGLLDYELTPDVRPAKVLPENFESRLVDGTKWPVVTFNQKEQACLSELTFETNTLAGGWRFHTREATEKSWLKFDRLIVGGDSGNPAFLLYGKTPILLYCLYSGGVGHGPMIHEYRRQIQKLMDELCCGYRLEEFDFEKVVITEMEQK